MKLALPICVAWFLLATLRNGPPLAAAEPVVVNPNGGWSWFGDERAVVDAQRGVLYVGSVANRFGAGGVEKDGDVEVARVDLHTGRSTVDVLHHGLTSFGGGDDHNCPGLLILPDGRCLAAYTRHNNGPFTHFRTFDPAAGQWSAERTFRWDEAIPGGCDFGATYCNLFYRGADRAVVNLSRNHGRLPNAIVSHDDGQSWQYAGQLLRAANVAGETGQYVNGYLKYSSRGDRIDLLATERHPRNYPTSLFHGRLEGSKLMRADGTVVDPALDAEPQADATDLTPVFRSGEKIDGVTMSRAWMIDLESYRDGVLATVFKMRADESPTDHRFFYAVFRDGQWRTFPLAKAGELLFPGEDDYTGLAALDPNSPDVVYVSTPLDPTTGQATKRHELYRGETADGGATWSWRAITIDSPVDNLRPIIPRWAPGRTALLWNRGTMTTSQHYDQEVMLLVDPA